ncbi:hypothetical protein TNCV_2304351 [Trichonephila clavipes]|nr:hypothetical protein TNCV_2304351 [Trichonephila clavipes]
MAGLGLTADAVELFAVGYILPSAEHELCMEEYQKGWLDNMLTKYQMIKLINFCEVWFLPQSVARVAAIVGDSPLPHASALIQRDFGCVLEVQQTKKLPHVAKIDLGVAFTVASSVNYEGIQMAMEEYFVSKTEDFFSSGLDKLPKC